MPNTDRLSREEDAALRRLCFFEIVGAELSPDRSELKDTLRARDARDVVRPPQDVVTVIAPPMPRGPLD
jgi:hypothetical protein